LGAKCGVSFRGIREHAPQKYFTTNILENEYDKDKVKEQG
jgi:hypothetical protein